MYHGGTTVGRSYKPDAVGAGGAAQNVAQQPAVAHGQPSTDQKSQGASGRHSVNDSCDSDGERGGRCAGKLRRLLYSRFFR